MKFQTMKQVMQYLDQFIQPPGGLGSGEHNFGRMKELMRLLHDPQNRLRVIHVAGTSGKGSTCVTISSLLHALGFNVGLTVSPHILDLRERTQIHNQLISVERYCKYLGDLVPVIEKMRGTTWGIPSFFEITMAHAFYSFYKENVDYAVIETGLGGRYDASNVVTREDKLAILTRIGMDHMDFLGDTIEKIALEKTHIIQKGNRVLSAPQEEQAADVIRNIARQQDASLTFIDVRSSIRTSLQGEYQKENVSVALAAIYELSKRDRFPYDHQLIQKTLQQLHFIGRFDTREIVGKKVILDGAHNPQKMEAFIGSLVKEYPDEQFDFLIAFRKGKEYREMLKYIVPYAHSITITEFGMYDQGMHGQAESSSMIEKKICDVGFKNVASITDPVEAWNHLVETSHKTIVVTGSLYLLSNLYSTIAELKD